MESRFIRMLLPLGVPGVALGIFYLISKSFGFSFSEIGPTSSAIIAIIFLLIVASITVYAIRVFAPQVQSKQSISSENANLVKTPAKETLAKETPAKADTMKKEKIVQPMIPVYFFPSFAEIEFMLEVLGAKITKFKDRIVIAELNGVSITYQIPKKRSVPVSMGLLKDLELFKRRAINQSQKS